ncbi:hypothetical protein [Bosea sp. (in: a-proteobacteria)]|uniref:hypothetical protein n=1 Tax=Bosea sp. (in: a-proteobacteria) TaxID=1871050 RepID=UPI001AD0F11D|nr:hypothetical protein [Bosea sp. (in: a-proteobacteria)]MBN9441129.1 hypothetical protein [Bosea sp. (in: a-proteobacteria)]
MVVTPHLTQAHSPEESAQHEASVPGMAHFAGTGPAGTQCFQCSHWNRSDALSIKRCSTGFLLPAPCGQYEKLTNLPGFKIPATQQSCRHFEPSESPPSLLIAPPPKAKKAGG